MEFGNQLIHHLAGKEDLILSGTWSTVSLWYLLVQRFQIIRHLKARRGTMPITAAELPNNY